MPAPNGPSAVLQACWKPTYAILDPNELCLPLPTGTGNNDIRFAFPLIAKTLLGLVMVRFDKGLEFGSVIWSSSFSLAPSASSGSAVSSAVLDSLREL